MIIVFGALKGGTGSTTLALNLAAGRARGHRVKFMDASPQHTAEPFMLTRLNLLRLTPNLGTQIPKFSYQWQQGPLLVPAILEAAEHFDDVIVDVGPSAGGELQSALSVADQLVSPITAGAFEAGTLVSLEASVRQALETNPTLRAMLVLNCVPMDPNSADAQMVAEFRDNLDLNHLRLADAQVHKLIAFRKSPFQGVSLAELALVMPAIFPPQGRDDIKAFYRDVWGEALPDIVVGTGQDVDDEDRGAL